MQLGMFPPYTNSPIVPPIGIPMKDSSYKGKHAVPQGETCDIVARASHSNRYWSRRPPPLDDG